MPAGTSAKVSPQAPGGPLPAPEAHRSQPTAQPTRRIEYLDSMRGLAALTVLLSHSFILQWPPVVQQVISLPIVNIPFNGREAVVMFFVLSGFVLARPYVGAQAGPPRALFVPTFYLRRFTRIWLPWLAIFLLSALAQATLFHPWSTTPPTNEWFNRFWHLPLTWKTTLRQCLFVEHDARVQLLVQDWSLGVELKGSLLMPLFILLCQKRRLVLLLAVAVGLFVLLPTGAYYDSFILGVLLARYGEQGVEWLKGRSRAFHTGLLLAGVLLYGAQHYGDRFALSYWPPFWLGSSVGCLLLIVSVMASRRLQAVLQWGPLTLLGRVSYSVYLLQFIVILCVLPAWLHLLNTLGVQRTWWLLPLGMAASVTLTVGLSMATYRWIEEPCMELGHRCSKAVERRFRPARNPAGL